VTKGPILHSNKLILPVIQNLERHVLQRDTIENMHLTQTMLLNSCKLGLYKMITHEVFLMELKHCGGPTTFFIMTKHIVATTDKASRAIFQRLFPCLQRVKLLAFPNKDVRRYLAVVTSIADHLFSCNKLPNNIDDIMYKGLPSTTIYGLHNYLTILHTTNDDQK
jgi:hypothetical protein